MLGGVLSRYIQEGATFKGELLFSVFGRILWVEGSIYDNIGLLHIFWLPQLLQ